MLGAIAASVLALSSILTAPARAQAYDFGVDVSRFTRQQDVAVPIVVGKLPLAANGSIHLRLEVRQMWADQYKWDLFILALSMFQNADQVNPLSWYQIAGESTVSAARPPSGR